MTSSAKHSIFLETADLSIGYPGRQKHILPGILNISVRTGELVALVGRNGIGKSTLLRTLSNLQEPVSGKVYLENRPLQDFSGKELATRIGFVSTEQISVNNLRVYDLVALGRYPYTNWFGTNRENDRQMIESAIRMVNLEELAYKNIRQISDGERQRAMIARTIAQDTQLIILDEPTAFLDLPNKYEIVNLLNRLSRERGKTVIFSTHELNIAIEEADKIWLMTPEGIHDGAPEDLLLEKKFASMFDKKGSSYISEKGELKIRKDLNRKIGLSGQGRELQLTRKALERIGFDSLQDQEINERVTVFQNDNEYQWQFKSVSETRIFQNIYSLVDFLKNR
jgi:iron complex transport system ATP-binding protein